MIASPTIRISTASTSCPPLISLRMRRSRRFSRAISHPARRDRSNARCHSCQLRRAGWLPRRASASRAAASARIRAVAAAAGRRKLSRARAEGTCARVCRSRAPCAPPFARSSSHASVRIAAHWARSGVCSGGTAAWRAGQGRADARRQFAIRISGGAALHRADIGHRAGRARPPALMPPAPPRAYRHRQSSACRARPERRKLQRSGAAARLLGCGNGEHGGAVEVGAQLSAAGPARRRRCLRGASEGVSQREDQRGGTRRRSIAHQHRRHPPAVSTRKRLRSSPGNWSAATWQGALAGCGNGRRAEETVGSDQVQPWACCSGRCPRPRVRPWAWRSCSIAGRPWRPAWCSHDDRAGAVLPSRAGMPRRSSQHIAQHRAWRAWPPARRGVTDVIAAGTFSAGQRRGGRKRGGGADAARGQAGDSCAQGLLAVAPGL